MQHAGTQSSAPVLTACKCHTDRGTHACTRSYCFRFPPIRYWGPWDARLGDFKEIYAFLMFYYIWQSSHGHACAQKRLTINFGSARPSGASFVHLLWREQPTEGKTEQPEHRITQRLGKQNTSRNGQNCEQTGRRYVLRTDRRSVLQLYGVCSARGGRTGPGAARAGSASPYGTLGRWWWRRRTTPSAAGSVKGTKI